MREGVWHQMGDRSQKLVREQLEAGVGAGVIISPRDLPPHLAATYAKDYRDRGAEVTIDPQFHVVGHTVGKLDQWPYDDLRSSVGDLKRIADQDLTRLTAHLVEMNASIDSSAVIAPALIYEAGRSDIVDANRRLFQAASRAARDLGVPTWGTVVIGRSAAASEKTLSEALSNATSVPADAWYFAVEFDGTRLPNDEDQIFRTARALLTVAAAGRPVLHAFAGPVGLVGAAAGARGVTVSHAQNLWQVRRDRLEPPAGGGGGGDAPPRLFSRRLWGTIVYPDEVTLLPDRLAKLVVEQGPFAPSLSSRAPFAVLSRWDAGKHLIWLTGTDLQTVYELESELERCKTVIERLGAAEGVHAAIRTAGVQLKDWTDSYQGPWKNALVRLLKAGEDDFMLLDLLR